MNPGKIKWIILLVLTVAGITALNFYFRSSSETETFQQTSTIVTPPFDESSEVANTPAPRSVSPPASLLLEVPFTAQAPTANWDELHNEACEEASAIMVNAYFKGITTLPPVTVESEINKLTKWQQQNFGYYLSITTEETAQMIEEVYNLKTRIIGFDDDAIKQALSENKLVIIPANGQMLDNPNFTPPGPIYHMLVITGYNNEIYITNDPGTRRGKNYEYPNYILEEATGNWSHTAKEVILSDKKIIIVSQ